MYVIYSKSDLERFSGDMSKRKINYGNPAHNADINDRRYRNERKALNKMAANIAVNIAQN